MSSYQVSEVKSIVTTSRYAIFVILPPGPHPEGGGGEMVKMPYLRTTVVELSSETCLIIVSDDVSDNETSFRTEIDHSGA